MKIRSCYVVRSPALGGEASSTPDFREGSHLPQPQPQPEHLPIGTSFGDVTMLRTAIYPQETSSLNLLLEGTIADGRSWLEVLNKGI